MKLNILEIIENTIFNLEHPYKIHHLYRHMQTNHFRQEWEMDYRYFLQKDSVATCSQIGKHTEKKVLGGKAAFKFSFLCDERQVVNY